ncbi:hypothetical protein EST38_g6530 [Candolleomyces aberdarensis]|uniref:JmjC domain-containing protein n=1 Tax=Candolleomyces aberdarensis TaxID=2316362 RepID=A0A4Q2DHK7_9AGAR|nr:hypothetical protein EST38_g6530 [Candolleomyces aberdarensis]
MLLRGILNIRLICDSKDTTKLEPETIVGPLLGALFVDPLWAVTTTFMASFCDEEIMVELEKLNKEIFHIIYRTAIGSIQGLQVAEELLRVLESDQTQATVRRYSDFYKHPVGNGVQPLRLSKDHPKLYDVNPIREEDEEELEESPMLNPHSSVQHPENPQPDGPEDPLDNDEPQQEYPKNAQPGEQGEGLGNDQDMEREGEVGGTQTCPDGGDAMEVDPQEQMASDIHVGQTEDGVQQMEPVPGGRGRGKGDHPMDIDAADGRASQDGQLMDVDEGINGGGDDDEPLSKQLEHTQNENESDKSEEEEAESGEEEAEPEEEETESEEEEAESGEEEAEPEEEEAESEEDEAESGEEEAKLDLPQNKLENNLVKPEKGKKKSHLKPANENIETACIVLEDISREELGGVAAAHMSNRAKSGDRLCSKVVELWYPDEEEGTEECCIAVHNKEQLDFFEDMYKIARNCFDPKAGKPPHLTEDFGHDSMFCRITEERYEHISADDIREKLGEGKLVVITKCEDKGTVFGLEQLRRVYSLDKRVHVQDQSIKPAGDYRRWHKSTTLREMCEIDQGPEKQKKALNALSFPDYKASPKDAKLGLDERIWNACNLNYGFKEMLYPCFATNWSIIGLSGACHGWHNDSEGFGTFVIVRSGLKWWVVGRSAKTNEKRDFFLESPDFDNWAVDEDWEVEALLLRPGTKIIMPPGMLHAVFTLESSVCTGGHYYSWETMEHTLHALIRSMIMSDEIINTEDYADQSRQILLRMMGYLHEEMILNDRTHKDDDNLPRLESDEHWIALSAFFCLIKLFNVVTIGTYRVTQQRNHLERRGMVWARGLMEQSMAVLSKRYAFDFEEELFEPMLGFYIFHIENAFASADRPDTKRKDGSPFYKTYVKEIFHQQLEWVLQTKPGAQKQRDRMSRIIPVPKVMKYTAWEVPEGLTKTTGDVVKRREYQT